MQNTFDPTPPSVPLVDAPRGTSRRNGFAGLDYLLQQRIPNTVSGAPTGTWTEWGTVAAFNFTLHADRFVAAFTATYPNTGMDWRLVRL